METLRPVALEGSHGIRRLPTGRPTLLAFVKDDCPTCDLTLPLLNRLRAAWSERDVDVLAVSQTAAGIDVLRARHSLEVELLDDDALDASATYDVETVPHVLLADEAGQVLCEFVGFGRAEWRDLLTVAAERWGVATDVVAWEELPELRPGCGSRTLEPGVAETIAARRRGGLTARRVEIAEGDDPFEFLFDQGLTDGLPVVPPTEVRVARMLAGTSRDPGEVVAVVPPNLAPVTVEKVAINAVMAGCRPEYLPVVLTAVEAACSEEFNLHGVLATTYFPTPVVIVNGPVRQQLGMNAGVNALGQGNRANATIGRALQLVVRNVGGGRPGEVDRAMLGQPGKFTCCFAEHEERSPWEPLHVERGFAPTDSTVTLFAGEAPRAIAEGSRGARSLAHGLGMAIESIAHPKAHGYGEAVLVVGPEHADTLAREGWSKDDLRRAIQEATARPLRDLLPDERNETGLSPAAAGDDLDRLVPKFAEAANLTIVVAGGDAGKMSAIIGGWTSGPRGSSMVTRRIDET